VAGVAHLETVTEPVGDEEFPKPQVKKGNPKAGSMSARKSSAARIPIPRFFPETGSGIIRDSGERVVSKSSRPTQPPDNPTRNGWR
jgi:hypothetical protein